jgi:hypothetical protein
MCLKFCLYTLTLEMMNSCYVKTLQEPSAYLCALCFFWICWYILRQEPKINLCGKQMLITKSRVLTSTIWCDNVDLLYLMVRWKSRMISFWYQNKASSSMVILPAKAICRYQCINLLHMLACDPLSFAKLLWPLLEPFLAFMIEITYTHIYMLTPTLGVTQNMPSFH